MRADLYLTENGYAQSRRRAQMLIDGGCVTVDGKPVTKSSAQIGEGIHDVRVTGIFPYVGRGGLKLEAALDAFGIDPAGKIALDIGASTGGFTDCLLQRGAAKVYAVDSGAGQLAEKLRVDTRVVSMERCNARNLTVSDLDGNPVDLIVMDVSFISATYLIPLFGTLLRPDGCAVVLVKPQFEVGRAMLGKGGIVKDKKAHRRAVERVVDCGTASGLFPAGLIASPIEGGDGNREFLLLLSASADTTHPLDEAVIRRVTG